MKSTESCTDQLGVDWGREELPAQAETDEAKIEGTRHSSAALFCCQHWSCELSDDKRKYMCYIFFSEKISYDF